MGAKRRTKEKKKQAPKEHSHLSVAHFDPVYIWSMNGTAKAKYLEFSRKASPKSQLHTEANPFGRNDRSGSNPEVSDGHENVRS